ncbi:uncharacterized protein LOC106050493 [Biomphalaria glabrata]|uniref:Uncharacterized protein LOC106050493 n=1 Tax=Biomphalaria glabrata TaxID=6526 RepID=A0A9W2YJ06_BIOGL|nr:uncharacterized protein LOC106050493 [Biomphalaria glabrata]
MAKPWVCILLAVVVSSHQALGQNLYQKTCSKTNSATIQPDATAWLGGILSLSKTGADGYGCGSSGGFMQSYEAIRWVLELLNKKNETLQTQFLTEFYVPGIKLGMKVINYCDNQKTAVAALAEVFPDLANTDAACTEQTNGLTLGIVGASRSGDTIPLADAAEAYDIPVISYQATVPELTLSGQHPNFMRTVSPDGPLMEVIVKVLTKLQWNYIAVVYDAGTFGSSSYKVLHEKLVSAGICLTMAIRVNADDDQSAEDTINKLLSTKVTGVIYVGPVTYTTSLINHGNKMLPASGRLQWIYLEFNQDAVYEPVTTYQRGSLFISAASRFIVEFEDHWIRINESNPSNENPWFTRWYEDNYNCKFIPSGTEKNCNAVYAGMTDIEKESLKRKVYQQDQYVEAAVMSVYTYAYALRRAQIALCGANSPGICPALRNMTRKDFFNNYLKKVNFTFTAEERVPSLASNNVLPYNAAKHLSFVTSGDVSDPSYYIWNFNDIETGSGDSSFKFRRVGTYINGRLDFNLDNVGMYTNDRRTRLLPLPSSICPASGCSPCLGLPAELKYYYEPGDIVINGIFSLHNQGSTPLTCGALMSTNQIMFLEAMIYAVKKANDDASILRSVKLGGLGMDDCSNVDLSQTILAQVQRGNLLITDTSGATLDPRTIEAYSAAYDTPLTLPLAEAMNLLMKPMVGYRAGGSELDDKSKYPYYINAYPGNVDEIKSLILLLKNQKWMYVQVVVSDLYYSQDSLKLFRELGARAGICIVATHYVGTTQQRISDALAGLQANILTTPVTVVFLEPEDIRRLLSGLRDNLPLRTSLVLISGRKWGTDLDVVKGYESVAEGVITLSLYSSTLESFRNYLSGLKADTYALNPWFKEWFSAAYNCSLTVQAGASTCDLSKSLVNGTNFRLLYQVESVINAITAIARGLHNTLRIYCGDSYTTVCPEFLIAQDKGTKFLEEIKKITFAIEDKLPPSNIFSFVGGSGAVPFEIYNFRSNNYLKVGDVNPWAQTLILNSIQLYGGASTSSVISSCQAPCLQCQYMFNYLTYWYIPGDLVIGAIFDVHYAGNGPFSCGVTRLVNGAFYTELFDFALRKINNGSTSVGLRNVTLGGLAFDGCTNSPRATTIINLVHTGMDIEDSAGNPFSTTQLISWMTYDSQTTIDAANLVQKLNIPIVSPGATSSVLDNKKDFYTFFRTIPSDTLVVKGMADFIKKMGWKYVVVVNSPDASSRQSRDLFRKYLEGYGICVVDSYEFETDGTMFVILDSIIQGDTKVVAVFAEPDKYIGDFLQAKQTIFAQTNLMFVANRPWDPAVTKIYNSQVQQTVFFDLNQPTIQDFITFVKAKDVSTNANPWFKEIFQDLSQCNLAGSYKYPTPCAQSKINQDWHQDIWTLSTLNAVYALANAIHKTLQAKCGTNYNGVCARVLYDSDVYNVTMSYMDSSNFTEEVTNLIFKFLDREADRPYYLMRYDGSGDAAKNQPLGQISKNADLTVYSDTELSSNYGSVLSTCLGDCLVCSSAASGIQDMTMTTGQFYIIGLFDIHKRGSSPFTCGAINDKHGLQLLEAFHFALEYVNNKTGIFRGKLNGAQIGGIGLDMCQSPARAADLVSNIHSERLKLKKDGKTVSVRDIDAYVATMDTDSSTRVADILTQLAVPQISYGATGMDLLDRYKYNYFLRSVPADDKQSRAIVSYLKKFRYNNIQVITSFDEIGEPGEKEFKRLSYVNKICITKEYLVGEGGNVAADSPGVISTIKSKKDAQVVILWMKNPLPLLEAASADSEVSRTYLFIATDKWGADVDYLNNPKLYQLLFYRNLVILDVETADIPDYDKYLEKKNPSNYKFNPWFQDYFEMIQNCYWDSPSGTRQRMCDLSSSIPRASSYVQDSYVLYVINAVFSVALGIHNALEAVCGQNYASVCTKFYYSGERRQKIMEGLLKVNFTDDTHQPFFYTSDGQSDRGFHIYNVTHTSVGFVPNQQPQNIRYQNVGSYNDTHFLKLDITYTNSFKAQCDASRTDPTVDDCVCPFPVAMPSRFMKQTNGNKGLSVAYIGDIHLTDPSKPLTCGRISTGLELYKLLAFFYAIDRVNLNANGTLVDSVKLDGLALDGCSQTIRLGQDVYNVLSGNQLCDSDVKGTILSPSSIVAFVIDLDRNTIPVARMLSNENITSISPTAGSALLSDRLQFPYFLRTRADNLLFANIVYQLAKSAGWDYLSVLYTDSLAYQTASDSLLDSSRAAGACVANSVPLSSNASLAEAQQALKTLSQNVGSKAVVLLVSPDHLKLLMEASQSLGLAGRFVWIVPYDWTSDSSLLTNLEQEMAGSLIIEPRSAFVQDFKNYISQELSWKNRNLGKIPVDWFQEIYETIHQCNILDTENPTNVIYAKVCTGNEVWDSINIPQDSTILHVMISVLSIAQGLSDISACKGLNLGIAACLQLRPNKNEEIYNSISKVNFRVLPELLGDKSFSFNFDGYKAGYVIKNYQVSTAAPNPYVAQQIGEFTNNGLTLDLSQYAAGNLYNRGLVPSSSCAQGTRCTCQLPAASSWTYEPISLSDPSSVKVNGRYTDPQTGQQVTVNSIPGIADRFPQAWAVILSVIAAVGAAVSLAIFLYLLIMYPVRGGTSILGYILSFGIILLYLMVFPFIAHADERICGLRRFALGLVYAIVYSALMVKLIDCFRVRAKHDVYNVKYSKMGRPVGLFLVTLFFVIVQVIINTEWLILEPPNVERIFYNSMYWPRCSPDDFYDEGLVLSLVYIMAIIFFSLIVGLFTYSSNKNHREARWILGILILSIPCWVIWCAVSILGAIKVRDAAVAIGLIVNATVMLALVPIRKLYLLHSYNKMLEEEEEAEEAKSQLYAGSQKGSNMYDNKPRLHDESSVRGSQLYSTAGH